MLEMYLKVDRRNNEIETNVLSQGKKELNLFFFVRIFLSQAIKQAKSDDEK